MITIAKVLKHISLKKLVTYLVIKLKRRKIILNIDIIIYQSKVKIKRYFWD